MKLPWVSRAKHGLALQLARDNAREHLREQCEEHTHQVTALRYEITNLRSDLLAQQNENAALRGQLMAQKHAQQGDV